MKKSIVLLLALFATMGTYAGTVLMVQTEVDFTDPGSLVAYLSTFIVLAATWLFKKVAPSIPGWSTMLIVAGISALLTYLTNSLLNPDLSWLAQFGLGLAATFVHQLSIQFSGSSSKN